MPYCPYCATANREGSRFCNDCGRSLVTETRLCQECGTVTPPTGKYCSACGARLSEVLGDSKPLGNDTISQQSVLPDLESLGDELPSLEAEIPSELLFDSLSFDVKKPAQAPPWLDLPELRTAAPGTESVAVLDSIETQPQPREDASTLPRWLDIQEPDTAAPDTEGVALPEAIEAQALPTRDTSPLPSWLDMQEPGTAAPDTEAVAAVESEVSLLTPNDDTFAFPRWLDAQEPEAAATGVESVAVLESVETLPPPTENSSDLPNWLDVQEPEAVVESTPSAIESMPADSDQDSQSPQHQETPAVVAAITKPVALSEEAAYLPDWLELDASQADQTEDYSLLPDRTINGLSPDVVAAVPDWLDLQDAEINNLPQADQAVSVSDDSAPEPVESPSWLMLEESQIPEPPMAPDIPEWLDLEEDSGARDLSAAQLDVDPDQVDTVEIPDWLLQTSYDDVAVEPADATQEISITTELGAPDAPVASDQTATMEQAPGGHDSIQEPEESLTDEPAGVHFEEADDQSPVLVEEITGEDFAPPASLIEGSQRNPLAVTEEEDETTGKGNESDVTLTQQLIVSKTFDTRPPEVQNSVVPSDPSLAGDLFADIPKERPSSSPAKTGGDAKWLRIISILLLLAVTAPFVFPLGLAVGASSNTISAYQAINQVPQGSTVLISFDWDGANNDEMTPIALAVLDHLTARNVKIIAVSLVPEGSQIAQQILSRIENRGYQYGSNFVNLGFLAGEKAGIQSMAKGFITAFGKDYYGDNLDTLPLMKQILSLRDTNMVISLAGKPELLQDWVTQISATLPGQKLVGGVTALGAPAVQPFVQSRQMLGLVSGLPGAAEYEWQGGRPGLGSATIDGQSLAHLAIVVLILGANAAMLVRRHG